MAEIKKAVALAVALCTLLAFFAIAAQAQSTNDAVCKLYRGSRFSGSGTLIGASPDGSAALVISCYHVCGDAPQFDCVFANADTIASERFTAYVFKLSSQWDLAALVLQNPGIPPAAIGDFTIRHPGIYSACGYGGGKYSAARGEVIEMTGAIIRTRCGIWGGHSGGGLFDPYGRWCGVTNWSTNNRAPMVNGVTKSRTGEPLQQFVAEAFAECGPFRKLFNRGGSGDGGGGGGCPPGTICPNPNLQGGGYGLAPEYTPLTPLASVPQTQQPAVTPAATITVPAPVPQQSPAPQAQTVTVQAVPPATPQPVQQTVTPTSAAEQQMNALIAALEKKFGVDSTPEPETGDAAKLLDDLPTVEVNVVYADRTEKATLDLRAFVLKELGAGEAKEEAK